MKAWSHVAVILKSWLSPVSDPYALFSNINFLFKATNYIGIIGGMPHTIAIQQKLLENITSKQKELKQIVKYFAIQFMRLVGL